MARSRMDRSHRHTGRMGGLRRCAAAVVAAAASVALAAGCADSDEPEAEPSPIGVVVEPDRACGATSDQVRRKADAVVETGLRAVGYTSVFVPCDGAARSRYDDDRAYLAQRGLRLEFTTPSERSAVVHMRRGRVRALRTDVSKRVMLAQPLIVDGDLSKLSTAETAALTNRRVLDLVRDPRNDPGAHVKDRDDVYSRAIGEQGLLVSFTNVGDQRRDMSVDIADLGLAGDDEVPALDVWTGERIVASGGSLTASVARGDTALLRIG